jgi:hypothetical protein
MHSYGVATCTVQPLQQYCIAAQDLVLTQQCDSQSEIIKNDGFSVFEYSPVPTEYLEKESAFRML